MFDIPIEVPTSVFCYNDDVYKNVSVPPSVIRKEMHIMFYHF